jgi:hypothetical protein
MGVNNTAAERLMAAIRREDELCPWPDSNIADILAVLREGGHG